MKKLFIALLAVLFFAGTANALDWYVANQSTVAWDPVTTLENGDPIPEGSVIRYQTYIANAVTDPNKENPTDTGIVDVAQKTFTLGVEGSYYVGAQTLREVDEMILESSVIAWTDVAEFCKDGVTFGLRFYLIPDHVEGMYSQ